jgi:ribosomal protein L7/L12
MSLMYLFSGAFLILIIAVFILRNEIPGPHKGVTDKEILALAKSGEQLKAIKWYRTLHKCSLKEAKSAVERMRNSL